MTSALLLSLSMVLGVQPVVLLSPEDRSMILGPIVQSVRAQLSDLPVELRVEPVPKLEGFLGAQMKVARQVAGPQGLAVVWLELSPGDPVFVYVADPQRNRVLARSVDWDGALGHLEAVGLIVRASVQALLSGQQIGFEAPGGAKPSLKDPPVVAPTPERRMFHVGVQVGYAPSLIGGDVPILQGLDASLFAGWGDHLFIAGGYRVIPPFLERASTYSLAFVSRHPVWFGVGGRLSYGRVQFGGELACNVDVVDVEMKDLGPWFQQPPPHQQTILSLSPTLSMAVTLVEPLSVYVSGGFDAPLNERHYITQGPTGRGVVITPWEVQPRVALGLRIDVL